MLSPHLNRWPNLLLLKLNSNHQQNNSSPLLKLKLNPSQSNQIHNLNLLPTNKCNPLMMELIHLIIKSKRRKMRIQMQEVKVVAKGHL